MPVVLLEHQEACRGAHIQDTRDMENSLGKEAHSALIRVQRDGHRGDEERHDEDWHDEHLHALDIHQAYYGQTLDDGHYGC
jgi:CxxC motif-containing protein (DUF1111 family)